MVSPGAAADTFLGHTGRTVILGVAGAAEASGPLPFSKRVGCLRRVT